MLKPSAFFFFQVNDIFLVSRFSGNFLKIQRLGRLNTFVGGLVLSSTFGCLQTIPVPLMTFELYAALEFLIAFATSGVLGATCAFNMEWVSADRRTYLNCMALFMDALHPVFIGLAAWYFESNFVGYKLSLALPGLVMIVFYFLLSEPPQWLLARQKYSRLIKSISNAGKFNRRPPSTKLIEQIENCSRHAGEQMKGERRDVNGQHVTIRDLFAQKLLVARLLMVALVWLCKVFAYYGIILSSTKVHDNKYISYILIGLAEIPGALVAMPIINRIGRRLAAGWSLFVYGVLLLVTTQMSDDLQVAKLSLFFISRASLKVSTIGFCTYVTELWPTAVRNRAFNICSLFGRFGAILASLSVMLTEYYAQLPIILYGSAAVVAAIMLYAFLPETKESTKMPDTIDEALAIGKPIKHVTRGTIRF